jgi:hypothetical protein
MKEMRKAAGLLVCTALILFPLMSYAVTQPSYLQTKVTWVGGMVGDKPIKVEGQTLPEISAKALQEAALSSRIVEYRTEDGKLVYRAYPDYAKSKCELVHEKAWQDAKLIMNNVKEVCFRDFTKYYTQNPFVVGRGKK